MQINASLFLRHIELHFQFIEKFCDFFDVATQTSIQKLMYASFIISNVYFSGNSKRLDETFLPILENLPVYQSAMRLVS